MSRHSPDPFVIDLTPEMDEDTKRGINEGLEAMSESWQRYKDYHEGSGGSLIEDVQRKHGLEIDKSQYTSNRVTGNCNRGTLVILEGDTKKFHCASKFKLGSGVEIYASEPPNIKFPFDSSDFNPDDYRAATYYQMLYDGAFVKKKRVFSLTVASGMHNYRQEVGGELEFSQQERSFRYNFLKQEGNEITLLNGITAFCSEVETKRERIPHVAPRKAGEDEVFYDEGLYDEVKIRFKNQGGQEIDNLEVVHIIPRFEITSNAESLMYFIRKAKKYQGDVPNAECIYVTNCNAGQDRTAASAIMFELYTRMKDIVLEKIRSGELSLENIDNIKIEFDAISLAKLAATKSLPDFGAKIFDPGYAFRAEQGQDVYKGFRDGFQFDGHNFPGLQEVFTREAKDIAREILQQQRGPAGGRSSASLAAANTTIRRFAAAAPGPAAAPHPAVAAEPELPKAMEKDDMIAVIEELYSKLLVFDNQSNSYKCDVGRGSNNKILFSKVGMERLTIVYNNKPNPAVRYFKPGTSDTQGYNMLGAEGIGKAIAFLDRACKEILKKGIKDVINDIKTRGSHPAAAAASTHQGIGGATADDAAAIQPYDNISSAERAMIEEAMKNSEETHAAGEARRKAAAAAEAPPRGNPHPAAAAAAPTATPASQQEVTKEDVISVIKSMVTKNGKKYGCYQADNGSLVLSGPRVTNIIVQPDGTVKYSAPRSENQDVTNNPDAMNFLDNACRDLKSDKNFAEALGDLQQSRGSR